MPKKNDKSSFTLGAGLLTVAALVGKLIGAFYKIPLTHALGLKGMGMYQSVFPTYALLVTLAGGGLTAAVSKITAESDGRFGCKTAVLFSLDVSVPLTVAAAAFSRLIARASGAPEAVWAFAVLLPGVPLSAVGAVLRGYFQGAGNMIPSAIGQIVEQAAKLAVGLSLAFLLAAHSLAAAVAGCSLGVTAAEGVSVLYYFFRYRKSAAAEPRCESGESSVKAADSVFYGIETLSEVSAELSPIGASAGGEIIETEPSPARKTRVKKSAASKAETADLIKRILKVSVPVTLGMIVLPLCQVADSFIIVNLLVRYGTDESAATALYGLVTGPVNALVNMPAVFTVGLCGMLLPKISVLVKRGKRVNATAGKMLAFSAAAGFVFCAGLMLCAGLVLRILYGASLGEQTVSATALLRIGSLSVLFIPLMQTSSTVLQGVGKAYLPAVGLLLAAVIKESLNFLLLPLCGIYGFVIATCSFYAVACIFDLLALALCLRKKQSKSFRADTI